MQRHYTTINTKLELEALRKLDLALKKFDAKTVTKNKMKVNVKDTKKKFDYQMEKYKLKYNLKDLRVVLHRFDEKSVSTVTIDTVEKNIIHQMIKLEAPAYHEHALLPFAVDKSGQYCTICTMEYTDKKKLFDHLRLSLEDSLFRCKICNIALTRKPMTIDLEKDWTNRIKCCICSVIF